jgi:putative acetyltransferase
VPEAKLVVTQCDPATPDAASLMAMLDADLLERYPGMPIRGIDAEELRRSGGVFLIGKFGGESVACGALRPFSGISDTGEVKRMFVRKDYRGRGFSRAILEAIETVATRRGYRAVRLETGVNQPEAIRLYESTGYYPIPCFGEFAAIYHSRCFEKQLPAAADAAGVDAS